ncbi:CLUMA_CG016203, isoform B [Clunio marinus]|uniref:CLUMA_CG016203, isoform B n=1 Tax=Clunio marinus TaxID=568069 RepID=A0A1J1IW72_9DIPT|nr:CLUMA_CG016203, isoform B [Clunio marinus]
MENYTSDSSDSDSHTIDYQNRNFKLSKIEDDFLNMFKSERSYGDIETIILYNNQLGSLPLSLVKFYNLNTLDVSNNFLTTIDIEVLVQCPLRTLIAKNNQLTNASLPKTFKSKLGQLRELNLSGNQLTHFPDQVLELKSIKYLYLNGNLIENIHKDVWKMKNLHLLSLGGNRLRSIPESIGSLSQLQALNLCDNFIEQIPSSVGRLHNLKTLSLHKNVIKTLPRELISLQNLTELSLRDNPLVVRFVQELAMTPTSLKEISARVVKTFGVPFEPVDVPRTIIDYLQSANCCVNPECKGVFFDNRVENIKFIDFCGKYRVPFLQYLCSSRCIENDNVSSDPQPSASGYMMRKVLLG